MLDAIILFFIFGALMQLLRVDFTFPEGLSRSLMMILLIAIGLKGGAALSNHPAQGLVGQIIIVMALGVILALLAFPLLRAIGQFDRINAANIAAHYGSVSVGTFAVAVGLIEASGIRYEAYFPLFVVALEVPAIIVGLALASKQSKSQPLAKLIHEMFLNAGVVLLVGGVAIGYLGHATIDKIMPVFNELFYGVLALFLLDMGIIAVKRIREIGENSLFLVCFAIAMPLMSSLVGAATGHYILGLSLGGTALLAVLAASASYIAVPAAMRQSLPQANQSISIAASLGVSFPFNVLVGIPLYLALAQWLNQAG